MYAQLLLLVDSATQLCIGYDQRTVSCLELNKKWFFLRVTIAYIFVKECV